MQWGEEMGEAGEDELMGDTVTRKRTRFHF